MGACGSGREDTKDVKLIAFVTVETRVEVVQRWYLIVRNVVWKNRKNYMATVSRARHVLLGNPQIRRESLDNTDRPCF